MCFFQGFDGDAALKTHLGCDDASSPVEQICVLTAIHPLNPGEKHIHLLGGMSSIDRLLRQSQLTQKNAQI
jgi:hypothetical protein